jgi:DNA-binding GntR family transcriptional regulator
VRPGERLVEARIAEDLGLSRTPVREALRLLASEGLVRFEPNRGASVRSLTVAEVGDLYELRARLEAMAGELAAQRATPEQCDRLAAAHDDFAVAARRAAAAPTVEALRALSHANDIFHLTMIEAAHHGRLCEAIVRSVDHTLIFQAFRHYGPAGLERSVLFHGLVVEAVRAGDGPRAGRLLHEHVLQGRDQLLAVVATAGTIDALYDTAPPPPAGGEGMHSGSSRS